ncbi:MAG: Enoyl-(Acyl carrier protein) reductase [Miltoncostaeaceae bacterium]|nr:Enoyl-(Acyl carrier protein) reductase [Miltoncostaeaceae bacterium]
MSALGRAPRLADVADVAAFLASDRAGGLTGTMVNVTAGLVVSLNPPICSRWAAGAALQGRSRRCAVHPPLAVRCAIGGAITAAIGGFRLS